MRGLTLQYDYQKQKRKPVDLASISDQLWSGSVKFEDSTLSPLVDMLALVSDPKELENVFRDLCSPNEWKSICDRWLVAQLLNQGISYRKIYELTGVSTATITRVARALSEGEGYSNLLKKNEQKTNQQN